MNQMILMISTTKESIRKNEVKEKVLTQLSPPKKMDDPRTMGPVTEASELDNRSIGDK